MRLSIVSLMLATITLVAAQGGGGGGQQGGQQQVQTGQYNPQNPNQNVPQNGGQGYIQGNPQGQPNNGGQNVQGGGGAGAAGAAVAGGANAGGAAVAGGANAGGAAVAGGANAAGAAVAGGVNGAVNGFTNIGSFINSLPKCFKKCTENSYLATSVGCAGITDINCICSKPQFVDATVNCASLDKDCSQNQFSLQQGRTAFASFCQNNSQSSTVTNSTGSTSSGRSRWPVTDGAISSQKVTVGSIILSAAFAGAAVLL